MLARSIYLLCYRSLGRPESDGVNVEVQAFAGEQADASSVCPASGNGIGGGPGRTVLAVGATRPRRGERHRPQQPALAYGGRPAHRPHRPAGFAGTALQRLQKVVSFDYTVVFAYRGNDRPVDLFDSFDPARRDVFVAAYQEGPYLLDPFYRACAEGIAPGLHRLRDLAPDQFQESEYFRSYYVRTGLTEEIGFFAPLKTEMMVVISLMRDGRSPGFSDEEMAKLRVVEPIVCAIASQHWRSPGAHRAQPGRSAPQRIDGLLDTVLAAFGCGNLTAREREIVRLLLLGHSIESTANRLSISTGTVKVHRRNIYSKLSIASHSELFSLFIVALSKL